MRISDEQVKILLTESGIAGQLSQVVVESDRARQQDDRDLVKSVTEDVMEMPDRQDMIADLKARIQAGTYNPTGEEIAESMIRRTIADRIR